MKSLTQIADQIAVCPVPGGGYRFNGLSSLSEPPTASSRCWRTWHPLPHGLHAGTRMPAGDRSRPAPSSEAALRQNARSHDPPFRGTAQRCLALPSTFTEGAAQRFSRRVARPKRQICSDPEDRWPKGRIHNINPTGTRSRWEASRY